MNGPYSQLLNGVIFIISICSQLTYLYDAQHGLVENCITSYPLTLQVNGGKLY